MTDYYPLCSNRSTAGNSSQLSRGWPGARKELEYHLGIKKGLKVVHGSIYHTHADMSKI